MTEIIKQLGAKRRCYDVIESCITADHWNGATNYIENYYKLTEDFLGYQELKHYLQQRRVEDLYPELDN